MANYNLMDLSKGNPGALNCLVQLTHPILEDISGVVMKKIIDCKIVGTDIYVMWSDICGKNFLKMAKLCKDCPDDILIDACSRQDYSGRELVAEYL